MSHEHRSCRHLLGDGDIGLVDRREDRQRASVIILALRRCGRPARRPYEQEHAEPTLEPLHHHRHARAREHHVVAFLAGPDGGWINGQIVRANGGIV